MNHHRGFSLLELLAALALLALLLTGIYSGVKTVSRSASTGVKLAQRVDEMRSAQQFLRLELTQVMALPWAIDSRNLMTTFAGTPRQMDFVAPLPGYLGRTGLQLLRLRLVPSSDDELRLEVAFAPVPTRSSSHIVPTQPEILIEGIQHGRFYYAGLDDQGRPTGWQSQWAYHARLPTMVGVELQLAGPVDWPRLDVPLRMDAGAINVREAVSRLTGSYAGY